jgi:hypothetical protein
VAIEASGRLCIIEAKLAAISEARRAVVAQVLSCAAYLHGMTAEQAEEDVLATPLARSGFGSLLEAAEQAGQEGSFDREAFAATLGNALEKGAFRLVLVPDEAPAELVRTVGFLQAVAPDSVIDLVTVTAHHVGDRRVLVPQRVEPTLAAVDRPRTPDASSGLKGTSTAGIDDFLRSLGDAPADQQPILRRLADWALDLQRQGLASLTSYQGARGEVTLLPKIKSDNVGLIQVTQTARRILRPAYRVPSRRRRRADVSRRNSDRAAGGTDVGGVHGACPTGAVRWKDPNAAGDVRRRRRTHEPV